MAQGFSLNIGLNTVDSTKYLGLYHDLNNAENDANFYYQIALDKNFNSKKLIGKDATSTNLLDNLNYFALNMVPGDILFLSFSGHGTRVRDLNEDEEEDEFDEVLVLFDRLFIDDEFQLCWARFKEKVRVFFITDSCYNGHVSRLFDDGANWSDKVVRGIDNADIDFERNLSYYKNIKLGMNKPIKADCSIIHIGACQDNQLADDGAVSDENGKFTLAIRKIYDDGNFKDSYKVLFDTVVSEMPNWEKPCWDDEAGQVDFSFIGSIFLQI
jgi:metacaspase-1